MALTDASTSHKITASHSNRITSRVELEHQAWGNLGPIVPSMRRPMLAWRERALGSAQADKLTRELLIVKEHNAKHILKKCAWLVNTTIIVYVVDLKPLVSATHVGRQAWLRLPELSGIFIGDFAILKLARLSVSWQRQDRYRHLLLCRSGLGKGRGKTHWPPNIPTPHCLRFF